MTVSTKHASRVEVHPRFVKVTFGRTVDFSAAVRFKLFHCAGKGCLISPRSARPMSSGFYSS
jgi:hypothetical protein